MAVFHEHVWFIAFKVNCSPAEFNCASTLLQLNICLSAEVAVFFESIQEEISEKKCLCKKKKKQNPPTNQPKKPHHQNFFFNCYLRSKRIRIMTSTESPFKCSCLQLFSHNSYSMFGHYLGNKSWNSHREMYLKTRATLSSWNF